MRGLIFFSLLGLLAACSPGSFIKRNLQESSSQLQHHTGFVLYDPVKQKNLVSINADKYFTPASNTKIFTLYAGLKILGDSVPALRWINPNDSLIVWGTGDPSFLYKDVFNSERTFRFLQNTPGKLFFSGSNFQESVYGPGWSWDDYQDYYQVERSSLPVYGNLISISKKEGLQPTYFKPLTRTDTELKRAVARDRFVNKLSINPGRIPARDSEVVPFVTSDSLTIRLLSDTLNREVGLLSTPMPSNASTFYSLLSDSIYSVMMQASDNFVAEQILLMCAQKISDSLQTDIAIKKVTRDFLSDLPDKPIWVDGSGLSRYNQFTPRSIVKLWEKIYALVPQQRLFSMLTSNGQTGTLRNMLKEKKPFIFGKTGSLANNYCLSGFIVTKKNHLLIFSSMNANFVSPTKSVRDNLAQTLTYIYEHY
jgi:D-alanyl-D-alanine carboxypeptidase/D-alanyl-D-alanine-endopeptidase (penicillin-binding protein 4)